MSRPTERRYPVARADVRVPINLATHAAILLEELGFPPILGDDMARLDTILSDFLYKPAEVAR